MAAVRKGRKRITFELDTDPGREVSIAGSFNGWLAGKKKLTDACRTGHYKATLLLFPGVYQYKFVVDGDWWIDPRCSDWVPNELGSLNSVVQVG